MKVLFTGATGFIGRVASQHLRSRGHDVINVTRSHVTPTGCVQQIHATLGSDGFVKTLLSQSDRCEAIVHAAACIDYDNLHPDLIRVNCLGTQQILAIAEEWKVRRVIYTSSLPVVGRPLLCPIAEEHTTFPRTTYHATKLFGEHLLAVASLPEMACASLRITAPVGPGMPDNRILSTFVRRALENRPLTLSGKGTRRQNYVDIRDIADAIVACVERGPKGVFNIGGAADISNHELAKTCIRLLESKSTIEFTGTPDPADDEVWSVCIDAAQKAFEYRPRHDMASSIKAVAQQYERGRD